MNMKLVAFNINKTGYAEIAKLIELKEDGSQLFVQNSAALPAQPAQVDSENDSDPEPIEKSTYTMEEVKRHNTAGDCWTTINGNVYNITPFISKHPGG